MTSHYPTFEQLYKNYYPKLVAYASFFLKTDEAHDMVQEVFYGLKNFFRCYEKYPAILYREKSLSLTPKLAENRCILPFSRSALALV